MTPRPRDTDPEAHRVQVQLLREAGPAKRLRLACSMSQTARALSLAGIRSRQPELSEQEARLRLVEICYGKALAAAVKARLERGPE